jgi:hypothetical protein
LTCASNINSKPVLSGGSASRRRSFFPLLTASAQCGAGSALALSLLARVTLKAPVVLFLAGIGVACLSRILRAGSW